MSHVSRSKSFLGAALICAGVLWPALSPAATLKSELFIDGAAGGSMTAGAPSTWEFSFNDTVTGMSPHHFHVMHAKPMHLVVISEDLSHFAHVHPAYTMGAPKPFVLKADAPTDDPDNFGVPDMVPFAGHYFVFAEVMPMDYGMLLLPYDLQATGNTHAAEGLTVDATNADGTITKEFENGMYRATLSVDPMDHCQIVLPHFNLVLEMKGENGFVPVQDLDPWLESYGHAIVIGTKGSLASEKIVQHLHAVWPIPGDDPSKDERGPNMELAAHSHGKSTATDTYRTWIQFKRAGKVYTFQFTFNWNLEKAKTLAKPDGAFCFGAPDRP